MLIAVLSGSSAVIAQPGSSTSAPDRRGLDLFAPASSINDGLDLFDAQPTNPPIIESIDVIGNDKTTKDTVLRRVGIEAGSLVDDDRLEAARLRLLGTGYFRAVEFSLERGSRRGRVVLIIEVEERNTVTIDALYYGGSNVSPFFGGLGFLESNFLGRGVSTGAGFVLGESRRAFDLHLFVPDLARTPLQLSIAAIFVQSGRETLLPDAPELGELAYSRIGGTVGLGFGVGPAQRLSLEYRLETIQVDRLPDLPPAVVRAAPSILFDESILSTLAFTFERDTRDHAYVPYSGHRIVLAIEAGTSLIGSSYDFTKYTAETYLALRGFADHALGLRLFGGFIQGNTPFFNQFFFRDHSYFAVGEDSLPRALGVNFSPANDYDDLIISAGAEYSIPIQSGTGFLYRTYLYGGVEVTATASLDELQEDPDGRGAGDRFPISADLGIKLDTAIGYITISTAYFLDLFL